MAKSESFYLGLDLSTQQLKGIVVNSELELVQEAIVDFDVDLAKYGIAKGVLSNPSENEIFAPVSMWLEALDLVLQRLEEKGADLANVKCVSGAGMQHGTVFWSHKAESLLEHLDAGKTLVEQLVPSQQRTDAKATHVGGGAFSHAHSPNWQDASTQEQCDAFDAHLGGPERLADVTGSKAHHRFSGPQIMRFREKYPSHYEATSRISLVSSFLASIFLGRIAPIDISDVCGMNLWNIRSGRWHNDLLALCSGGEDQVSELRNKLGAVGEDGGEKPGNVSPYFVTRYGFRKNCVVALSTGDNPATILALPLRAGDAVVSLGTSTTFLMSTSEYKPDPAYHFFNHPATPGLYMFMLCYKNGGLAREGIRDRLNASQGRENDKGWNLFNESALTHSPLDLNEDDSMKMGLYFPRPEIVPNVRAGEWHFTFNPSTKEIHQVESANGDSLVGAEARAIVESQMLSLRLRSRNLVHAHGDLPPQPRRIYLVGGGSKNNAIAQICGEVLGGVEGVFRLDIGGNACALGAAYKAAWAVERQRRSGDDNDYDNSTKGLEAEWESFEEFVGKRWREEDFVKRICDGYNEERYKTYGVALEGFQLMEQKVLDDETARRDGEKQEEKYVMGSAMSRQRDTDVGQRD